MLTAACNPMVCPIRVSQVRKGAFDRQIFVELNSLMKREKNSCMVFTLLPEPPAEYSGLGLDFGTVLLRRSCSM